MKAYADKSGDEYSLHQLDIKDIEALHASMVEQVNRANTVGTALHSEQKKRLFNLIKILENEILIH